ncbi:hypothetical protein [Paenibacillus glycinis]|uniref:Flagellin N-terminal domain-containing protein n=1 Tax=Paenibacillus glycinis TaxID=2697035 RepID=A0ABW9XP68_9BACL|nr:hypothetical protein [Paenibacillus glycinis]NBD24430.1 hypothetical protein [Paenibacillus glycinis]
MTDASEKARQGAVRLADGLGASGLGDDVRRTCFFCWQANEPDNGIVILNALAGLAAAGLRDLNGLRPASDSPAKNAVQPLSAARSGLLASINSLRSEFSLLSNGLKAVKDSAIGLSNLSTAM